MMHSKKHKGGFTLIEVVLALMITALTLTPIFIMHGTIVQRVFKSSRAFDVIMYCKELLYFARQKQEAGAQEFSLEKPIVDFDGTRTYRLEKGIDQKSSLASIEGLHKEFVTMSWTEQGQKKHEQLVTFVYKKPAPTGKS
jgi:prepilin-type N-terminal cleavage/methylation domain-containing protein